MRWTKEEENLLQAQLAKYKMPSELPLVALSEKLKRTPDSIRRKAQRLAEVGGTTYEWDPEESKEAFLLYLQELPSAAILYKLHRQGSEATIEQLEDELKRLREAWTKHIRTYAEGRGLATAKRFTLSTIGFYISNRETTQDFVRKVLHGKIKNG